MLDGSFLFPIKLNTNSPKAEDVNGTVYHLRIDIHSWAKDYRYFTCPRIGGRK